ncbi:MAG: hypothetical protein Q7J54_01755 [Candidatus Woesearchaeota archaeon]|nr:hypothetical protein [Candidatus Woesearchaeota archaeon]
MSGLRFELTFIVKQKNKFTILGHIVNCFRRSGYSDDEFWNGIAAKTKSKHSLNSLNPSYFDWRDPKYYVAKGVHLEKSYFIDDKSKYGLCKVGKFIRFYISGGEIVCQSESIFDKEDVGKVLSCAINDKNIIMAYDGTSDRDYIAAIGPEFEYHLNPYYFCFDIPSPNMFLNILGEKIPEIRKVLPKAELIKLIKRWSDKTIISKAGGVAVVREKSGYAYPRYFIRKRLRELGIDLGEGEAEKNAKELGLE